MSSIRLAKKGRIPKKAVQGHLLLDRIFERDLDKGAVFVEISGIQGCGKTSLMLGFATKIMRDNPEEIVFWREPVGSPAQFNKIGDDWQILAEKNYPLEVLEITNDLCPADVKIRYFRDYKELIRMAKPGLLNVVYFHDLYKWIDLVDRLKLLPGWQTCFWDEYEDICPEHSSGLIWKKNKLLSNSLKQVRKGRVSLIVNSQSSMDSDFRVRSKAMMWIYLHGARVDKNSPIKKQAVQALMVGAGWVDHAHSLYGQFQFPPFKPKEVIYTVMEVQDETM